MELKVRTVLEQAIEDLTKISKQEDEEFELNLQINDDIKIVLNEIERLNNIIDEMKEKNNLAENILYDYLYKDKKITKEKYYRFKELKDSDSNE